MSAVAPDKWSGASAYDCNQPESSNWNTPVENTIAKLGLEKYLDHKAFVFQIGHGADEGACESTMREALLSDNSEIECVISIIPGRLAVCYGHSGEFRLCRRNARGT